METTEGLSAGRGRGEWGEGTGTEKQKWQVQNRRGRLGTVWEMEKPKDIHA